MINCQALCCSASTVNMKVLLAVAVVAIVAGLTEAHPKASLQFTDGRIIGGEEAPMRELAAFNTFRGRNYLNFRRLPLADIPEEPWVSHLWRGYY